MRRVIIIGSGGVAEALAKGISACEDLQLIQIFGRNEERVKQLSKGVNCGVNRELQSADIYIVAVSDRAISQVTESLSFPASSNVAHTAGSVEMESIYHPKRGVLYPLQSFTSGRDVDLREVPFFVEGSSPEVEREIDSVARALSGNVMQMDSSGRKTLHLCGVFASNFVNAIYSSAADIAQRAGIPFGLLKPLIQESCQKALSTSNPREMQTGPAVRGDLATQQRHIEMLKDDERLQEIYKILSLHIWETSKKM